MEKRPSPLENMNIREEEEKSAFVTFKNEDVKKGDGF
jgi:hypothetical protein